ncbi:unnamed protein product [Cylindrotheca closterium]|uniref:Transcription factor MYC/MYB N-terminal domain-containing protein n=1 Tax=Cylindrotheca closterium TaxID=2856 RepID=A0AAD2JGB3_9STRA|nr:unnamed protein product [Cylindrotheca closterium]
MATTKSQQQKVACKCCQTEGSDGSFTGCGCTFHVRCLPPSVIRSAVRSSSKANDKKEQQECRQDFTCPFCNDDVSGIYLFPLPFDKLEKAINLKTKSSSHQSSSHLAGSKRKHDGSNADEVAFSVYSKWRTGTRGMLADSDQHRTGRWTDSEMAFVDHIVTSFDEGKLSIAEGVKLNTLLCDLLQCKSSRLTKKMKNAKLSTRAFKAAPEAPGVVNREDCQVLSALQEKFLSGRPTEAATLELEFNFVQQWRSYFSNFCMQAGYMFLDSNDWMSSIEDLEQRASTVEEKFRKVKRRSMSKALNSESKKPKTTATKAVKESLPTPPSPPKSVPSAAPQEEESPTPSLMSVFDEVEEAESVGRRPRTFSEDFDNVLEDLACGGTGEGMMPLSLPDVTVPNHQSSSKDINANTAVPSTFQDLLRLLMEAPTSPYHHADIWVPSFVNEGGENIQLLHAGYATRRNVPEAIFSSMNAFGEYSKSFTFKPEQGLPGRVFSTGKSLWIFELQDLDHHSFTRASGASNYGLKTATGISLNTPGVGRMVVVFYSCHEIAEDKSLADQLARELTKYAPQPKWKLVIDINQNMQPHQSSANQACPQNDFHTDLEEELISQSGIVSPSLSSQKEPTRPTSPLEVSSVIEDSIESEIISLLGNETTELNGAASSSTTSSASLDTEKMVPHYMTIRLLLLRPASRRTSQENEILEVLKSSYLAYMKGSTRRNSGELAKLLVRDWVCMKFHDGSFSIGSPSMQNCDLESKSGVSLLGPPAHAAVPAGKKLSMLQTKQKNLCKPAATRSMESMEAKSRRISVEDVFQGCS